MKTREVLESLPKEHRKKLEEMRNYMRKAKTLGNHQMEKEYRMQGCGYIRCLEASGIVEEFRTLWIWFTL